MTRGATPPRSTTCDCDMQSESSARACRQPLSASAGIAKTVCQHVDFQPMVAPRSRRQVDFRLPFEMIARHATRVLLSALTVFAIAVSFLASAQTLAALSRPPGSYVVPVDDGQRMFVMFSYVSAAQDEGDLCVLPTGEKVSLHATFPSSGLYEKGSVEPIWTVNWFEEKNNWKLSHNGRYLVRINELGGGFDARPSRRGLAWGIKIYDRGKEIWSSDVKDLVDYPALMRPRGYQYQRWYDDVSFVESQDGKLLLDVRTST
jgi:hypothetical protein